MTANDDITRLRETMASQDRELAALFDRFRELDPDLIPAAFADELEAALEPKPSFHPSPLARLQHTLRA